MYLCSKGPFQLQVVLLVPWVVQSRQSDVIACRLTVSAAAVSTNRLLTAGSFRRAENPPCSNNSTPRSGATGAAATFVAKLDRAA